MTRGQNDRKASQTNLTSRVMLFKVHWKPSEYIPEGNSLTKMTNDKTPEKTDAHFNFLYWKVIILLHV